MRSWREWVDDTRAGAAKWEMRWQQSLQHGREHRLARRVEVRGDAWLRPDAAMARRVLEYMRLVRAPHIHAQRRASPRWQAEERQRLADVAAAEDGSVSHFQCTEIVPRIEWYVAPNDGRSVGGRGLISTLSKPFAAGCGWIPPRACMKYTSTEPNIWPPHERRSER